MNNREFKRIVEKQSWMTDMVYEWACLEKQARLNSYERMRKGGKKVLIAIKAQHPLNEDGTPGSEYRERLEKALEVAERIKNAGMTVNFMTFGGIHEGCSRTTLADAGKKWLQDHGVKEEEIEEKSVVFSGNDEDRLAAEKFAEENDYRELHVILSAGQWDRARLYYIYMGWQPHFHPVTFLEEDPNHSSVCELWGSWAVPAFAEGPEAIKKVTEEIRNRHLEGAMK